MSGGSRNIIPLVGNTGGMLPRARMCSTTRHQPVRTRGLIMFQNSGIHPSGGCAPSAKRQALHLLAITPIVLCLSACGGGSTGGGVNSIPAPPPTPAPTPTPTPTAFSNWQSVPVNGVLRLSGSTVEAPYNKPSGLSSSGTLGTVIAGSLVTDITYNAGVQTGISVQGGLSSVNFNNSDGSTKVRLAASPNIIKYASPSGSTSLIMVDAPAAGYSYMSYGAWSGLTTSGGGINGFQGGTVTQGTSVPTTGSVTYVNAGLIPGHSGGVKAGQ
jgi:hypothetical protein